VVPLPPGCVRVWPGPARRFDLSNEAGRIEMFEIVLTMGRPRMPAASRHMYDRYGTAEGSFCLYFAPTGEAAQQARPKSRAGHTLIASGVPVACRGRNGNRARSQSDAR
jgi:hypothetical protein